MASGFEDQAKISALPQEGVHCFPANAKQINSRRVITAILFVLFAMAAIYGFMKMGMLIILACVGVLGAIISVLVFAQTFLIAKYRVAVDYNEKNVVLRYRYSKIAIPFENFDGRDGSPDQAEELINKNFKKDTTYYLVLDDVFEDACYQTSSTDLESVDDFKQLRDECFAIAEAYGARNSKDKVKFYYEKGETSDTGSTEIDAVIEETRAEKKAEEEAEAKKREEEQAAREAEEAAKEAEEASEEPEAETEEKSDAE